MRLRPAVPGIVTALALAATGCASPANGTPAAGGDVPLKRTEWRLVERTTGGRTVPVGVGSTLWIDDDGRFVAAVCNNVNGRLAVDGTEIDFRAGQRISTDMMCHGEPREVEQAFHAVAGSDVAWEVDGTRLTLRAPGGDSLVYEARDNDAYPADVAVTLFEGERDGARYRLGAAGGAGAEQLVLQLRPAAGELWQSPSVAAPSPGEPAMWMVQSAVVGSARYVFGFAPAGTARVGHRATGDAPEVALTVGKDVPGWPWAAFGGFVGDHSGSSVITAYGADGRVLERWGRP